MAQYQDNGKRTGVKLDLFSVIGVGEGQQAESQLGSCMSRLSTLSSSVFYDRSHRELAQPVLCLASKTSERVWTAAEYQQAGTAPCLVRIRAQGHITLAAHHSKIRRAHRRVR